MTKNITCKEAQIALETAGLDNFSDRFVSVIDMRIDRCMKKDMSSIRYKSICPYAYIYGYACRKFLYWFPCWMQAFRIFPILLGTYKQPLHPLN